MDKKKTPRLATWNDHLQASQNEIFAKLLCRTFLDLVPLENHLHQEGAPFYCRSVVVCTPGYRPSHSMITLFQIILCPWDPRDEPSLSLEHLSRSAPHGYAHLLACLSP